MEKIRKILSNPLWLTLAIAILWQLTLTFIGWALVPHLGPLGHMSQWDAGWYLHIIQYGYSDSGSPAAPAFYPLFPLLIHLGSLITFGLLSPLFMALILNTLALWAILYALVKILKHFNVSTSAIAVGVISLLVFPSAFFLHAFYSEAIFIALAFWSYYFALKRHWWIVGTLLAILTMARLPSLLFIALCGLEYLRSYQWSIKRALNKNILWFLLAPLGFISYGAYLSIVRSDFFAMFHAYSATNDWGYQVFNPNILQTLYETVVVTGSSIVNGQLNYEIFINTVLPLIAIIGIAVASVYTLVKLKQKGVPLFTFGILSIILFTLNSNVVSVHRYALACLVIYVAIALFSHTRTRRIVIIIGCLVLLGIKLFIYHKFITGAFAG